MISVSFYLHNPKAKIYSQVYALIIIICLLLQSVEASSQVSNITAPIDSIEVNDSSFQFNRISYSTSVCNGYCQAFAVELNSNGFFKFWGVANHKVNAGCKGTVQKEFLESIVNDLRMARLDSLPKEYPRTNDRLFSEMILHYNDSLMVRISGSQINFPESLRLIIYRLRSVYIRADIEWVYDERLSFETTAHLLYLNPEDPYIFPEIKDND